MSLLIGVAGFEPTNARVKVWCLTAWLYPIIYLQIQEQPEKKSLAERCRHRSIFPGRLHPSIFDANELNFRVRNGNGWILIAINTGLLFSLFTVP